MTKVAGVGVGSGAKRAAEKDGSHRETKHFVRKAQKIQDLAKVFHDTAGRIFFFFCFIFFPKIKLLFQERVGLIQSSHLSQNLKNDYNFLIHTLAKQYYSIQQKAI